LGYNALRAGLAFVPLGVLAMIAGGKVATTLLNRRGVRTTLTTGMVGYGIGLAALVSGMSVGGSYWAVLPGLALYGFGGGLAFTTVFVAASAGVAPTEQGVASALASTSLQMSASVGLALILLIANSGDTVIDGLHTAGWVAAAGTLFGGALALTMRREPRGLGRRP